jgi:membrane protease YdiL (CAAX protease family)
VLWIVTFGIGRLVVIALRALSPSAMAGSSAGPLQGELSWWAVGAALAINPLFEEVLWLGYAVPQLERRIGFYSALLISLALRTAVHYNQGALALISVLPVGLVFTLYYARWRRVWPVVVAHIIVNAFGLGAFISGSK